MQTDYFKHWLKPSNLINPSVRKSISQSTNASVNNSITKCAVIRTNNTTKQGQSQSPANTSLPSYARVLDLTGHDLTQSFFKTTIAICCFSIRSRSSQCPVLLCPTR